MSAFFFRRAKQTFAEHLVLNSYRAAGELLISTAMALIFVFVYDIETMKIVSSIFSFIFLLYSTIFYYQYFSAFNFSRKGLLLRSVLTTIILYVVVFMGLTVFFLLTKTPT
jgi:hypothetical protein